MKLLTTTIFVIVCFGLYAQEPGNMDYDSTAQENLIGLFCSQAKDYALVINGIQFEAKHKKAYICETDLPAEITVISLITGMPITATDVVWTGNVNGAYGAIYQAELDTSHFDNKDKASFTVEFTENGKSVKIKKFVVSKDIRVLATRKNNPKSYFDDVKLGNTHIDVYWPSETSPKGRPWLFVPPGGTQTVTLNVGQKNGKKYGRRELAHLPVHISNNGGTAVSPANFNTLVADFDVSQADTTAAPFPFLTDCMIDSSLYIYSYKTGIEYGLEFKEIVFSHDDVQLHDGPVLSDTTLCVGVGPDGFYTEGLRHGGPSYASANDSIVEIIVPNIGRMTTKILAGKNKTCNTTVPSHYEIQNKIKPNRQTWIDECNSVYNDISVNFEEISYDTLKIPQLKKMNPNKGEFGKFTQLGVLNIFTDIYPPPALNNVTVYIVDFIPGDTLEVQGRASGFGTPKVSVITKANGFTLAHEIGHGLFALRHPDNDKDHLGSREGDTPPNQGPFNFNDTDNFMYSIGNKRKNLIRHYQCVKILRGKYY
jgi:hypothetical protein